MQKICFSEKQSGTDELALQAASGDERAFSRLMLEYEPVLRNAIKQANVPQEGLSGETSLGIVVRELYGNIEEFPEKDESFGEWLSKTVQRIVQAIQPEDLLLERAKSGDPEALGTLLFTYKPVICRVAQKYLPYMRGFGDEDDIFHEVALRAQPAIETFDGNSRALKNWLAVTCCNLCKEVVRKIHPHIGGLQIKLIDVEDFVGRLFSHEPDPARSVLAREELGCAAQAFASLSEKHQEVLRQKYGEDSKYKEIAQTLKVPIGTVSKRIHSAMQQFRKHLEFCEEQGLLEGGRNDY